MIDTGFWAQALPTAVGAVIFRQLLVSLEQIVGEKMCALRRKE